MGSSATKDTKKDEGSSSWVKTLAKYVEETRPSVLNLEGRGLGIKEVQCVLNLLSHSQVTELNLKSNCLTNGMVDLAPLLIKTKLKKLNVSACALTSEDMVRLAEVLTNSQIADLVVVGRAEGGGFDLDGARKHISRLQKSKLTRLVSNFVSFSPPVGISSSLQDCLKKSVSCLDLRGRVLDSNDLIFLFANLGQSAVTSLNLQDVYISSEALQELSRRLVETKVEKLNLGWNNLRDGQLHILVQGLVNSKVTNLNLMYNLFTSLSPLFTRLKETRITVLKLRFNYFLRNEKFAYPNSLTDSSLASLDLHDCQLSDEAGKGLMESLRFSNVMKLDVSHNYFSLLTVKKFAANINDIKLNDLDISHNNVPLDEFFTLGECLKKSKLKRICVSGIESVRFSQSNHLLPFLKLTEGSSVSQVEINEYPFIWNHPVSEPQTMINTRFTELHLRCSCIKDNISNLMSCLKYSSVTHLNLCGNRITDDGVATIAEYLKETQIVRLNLNHNSITSRGAKALALLLKDTNLLYLHLNKNSIRYDGLESLAQHAKDTYMTVVDVVDNPVGRVVLLDEVLWKNKISVHKLVSFFEQIAPRPYCDEFCFDQNSEDSSVSTFLEKFTWFYKTFMDKPRAINILVEAKSVLFSREQIRRLIFKEFPRQFSRFIACRIETDAATQVSILEQAEEMGLTAIVEELLLHRPVYMLDEEEGILYPYVYKLLLKYRQPICNLAVEPRGVVKIVEYFTQHADLDGAQDVINLLQDSNIS